MQEINKTYEHLMRLHLLSHLSYPSTTGTSRDFPTLSVASSLFSLRMEIASSLRQSLSVSLVTVNCCVQPLVKRQHKEKNVLYIVESLGFFGSTRFHGVNCCLIYQH